MKKIIASIFLIYITITAIAQKQMQPMDGQGKVEFRIKNFGFTTTGNFSGIKGSILFDPNNLDKSKFSVTIAANTVNTENTRRDNHLRSADFFDVEKYPTIKIESSAIEKTEAGFILNGTLTIKNVSKKILIPFTSETVGIGYRFSGSFTINRLDYTVGEESATLSDDVIVNLIVVTQ